MEALKVISEEQLNKIKKIASDEQIEKFFNRLNYNYGDGEVLSFEHIKNIFEKKYYDITNEDYLTIYVDTYRSLKLLKKDQKEILTFSTFEEIKNLHETLSNTFFADIKDVSNNSFEKAIKPFIGLTQKINEAQIELISTLPELNYEGEKMNHCIATYANIVIEGQYIGFRVFNKKNGERLTLGCLRKGDNLFFNQLKGYGNAPASKESCSDIIEFCKKNNITILPQQTYDLLPALLETIN